MPPLPPRGRETALNARVPNTPAIQQAIAEAYRAGMAAAFDAVEQDLCAAGSPQAALLALIRARHMASEIKVFQR